MRCDEVFWVTSWNANDGLSTMILALEVWVQQLFAFLLHVTFMLGNLNVYKILYIYGKQQRSQKTNATTHPTISILLDVLFTFAFA